MTLLVDTNPFPMLFRDFTSFVHVTMLGKVGVVTIMFLSLRACRFEMLIRKEVSEEGWKFPN